VKKKVMSEHIKSQQCVTELCERLKGRKQSLCWMLSYRFPSENTMAPILITITLLLIY